ncbi:hypothetical protein EPD60_00195 [Flaviaesturariibacter flavus]|uniref:Uncharacterized protein n=1 Tax=Flaviaesturariibacter flavus TaxID=2502780 RepID=A0A4R1BPM6_9BACT|nr:hypothetical protein [Flaviaesturariibacter flavus]TCJ19579.1 hypothetical protein EPD60_00195 [Flaviaesturariibacter flavus]
MYTRTLASLLLLLGTTAFIRSDNWQSKWVQQESSGALHYTPDEKGNIIPDFSRVGFYSGDRAIPDVPVVATISPSGAADDRARIQAVIDEVTRRTPDASGYRGTVLLKKGSYRINGSVRIPASGIVLRGEGNGADGTRLIATAREKSELISVSGSGNAIEIRNSRTAITDTYVPTGSFSFHVANGAGFQKGDAIIVLRPGTQEWVHDLKMDQIVERNGTKQWQAEEFTFRFERVVTKVEGNTVFIDNPIVMPLETKYGGGFVYKYAFDGRIRHVGVENLYCESEYDSDTSENHAWDAVKFSRAEQGWVRSVTARHFAYSCVNLASTATHITVMNSNCFDHKSVITGGRRYSFNNDGQLNLFMNCTATDGRHDFVTGARVHGPNVFVNCSAKRTHADIGPHHRWAMGTLYDNIVTDGEINVQDRGNMGSGHGWVGTTQVLWNCTAKRAAVQSPYGISGNNYCIGLKGEHGAGHFPDRPDGIWEGLNRNGLTPASLYEAQLKARRGGH